MERRREAARAAARSRARTHGLDGSLPVVLLPALRRALAPLPEDRRVRFAEHLDHVLKQASGTETCEPEEDETSAPDHGVPPVDAVVPLVGAACGVCGGRCCEPGGDTAFLEAATLLRARRAHGTDLKALRSAYLERLPGTTWEGSCVYHGERGCALPRSLRSRVCNQYLCTGIADLVRARRGNGDRFLVASVEGAGPDRIGLAEGHVIHSLAAEDGHAPGPASAADGQSPASPAD